MLAKQCFVLMFTLVVTNMAMAICNTAIPKTTSDESFAQHDNGTVTHNKTGLMWMSCVLGQIWDGVTCSGSAQGYTWQNALQASAGYAFAGYNDWRLPNKNELVSIVEEACYDPAINTLVFPNDPASYVWSSSPYVGYRYYAWNVGFGNGAVGYGSKAYGYYVRLVRSGQDAPIHSATIDNTQVKLTTSLGGIIIELNNQKAPITSANFINYAKSGFYNRTIFHRIIPDFVAQGGGFDTSFALKETKAPIKNEADNGLKNKRGSIAMARTNDPNSATTQFFINLKDNDFLNYTNPTPSGWGYAVFGEVIEGMAVVDEMAKQPTGSRGGHQDVPITNIVIEKVELIQ